MPLDEVTGEEAERPQKVAATRLGRRDLLRGAAIGAAAAMLPRPGRAASGPRIVIVVGGLAGIRCAHMVAGAPIRWASCYGGQPRRAGTADLVDSALSARHVSLSQGE
jgi:hypothetical protein